MNDSKRLIGLRIMQRRKELGLSQEKLAEKLDISKNHLSNIERGKQIPTTECIFKICNTIGYTPDYYLIGTPVAETDKIVKLIKTLPKDKQQGIIKLLKFYIDNLVWKHLIADKKMNEKQNDSTLLINYNLLSFFINLWN